MPLPNQTPASQEPPEAPPRSVTPNSHTVAGKWQSGDVGYKQEQLKDELESDISKAMPCGIDNILMFFLYNALDEKSEEKKELDRLQNAIEELQAKRYYKDSTDENEEEVDQQGSQSTTPGSTSPLMPSVLLPGEDRRPGPESDEVRSQDEKDLIGKRDSILTRLLEQAIEKVLTIADDEDVRTRLVEFEKKLQRSQHEKTRYAPYVELCNLIFQKLGSLKADKALPLRTSSLQPEMQVLDPSPIQSEYEDMENKIERKPDAGLFSACSLQKIRKNLQRAKRCATAPPPSDRLKWRQPLSCTEFKISDERKPRGLIEDLGTHKYTSLYTPSKPAEVAPEELDGLDPATVEDADETERNAESSAGIKRDAASAGLGSTDGERGPKKPTPRASPVGSTSNTPGSQQGIIDRRPSLKAIKGRVQCASYALEMMSYGAGIHHVINILITDGILWIWYYDRQGIIQSGGISIFEDFPRFIVLLLAFHRFTLEDWGVISALNPDAVAEHTPESEPRGDGEVMINIKEDLEDSKHLSAKWEAEGRGGVDDLTHAKLHMNRFVSNRPHCLAGRATAVVEATGLKDGDVKEEKMVCKVYHPEVSRINEGVTLEIIYSMAEEDREAAKEDEARSKLYISSMFDHLPKVYFYGDVKGTTTQRIRSMLNCSWKGPRVMRVIGMKKLQVLTTLKGWDFAKAWLEGMICHSFLWKNFIEHGDPSLSNLMYDSEKRCGVLTDFDLSLLQWEPHVYGSDRTGTVPFMAVDILTPEYWEGRGTRFYYHEMESFIWILPYVFLLYQGGTRRHNKAVDVWRTSSFDVCLKEKLKFWLANSLARVSGQVQPDFSACWPLARDLCVAIRSRFYKAQDQDDGLQADQGQSRESNQGGPISGMESTPPSSAARHIRYSQALWDQVYLQLEKDLRKGLGQAEAQKYLKCLEYFKPSFTLPEETKQRLHNKFKSLLYSIDKLDGPDLGTAAGF